MLILLNDVAIFPIRRIFIRFITLRRHTGEFCSYISFRRSLRSKKDRAFCENHAISSVCRQRVKYRPLERFSDFYEIRQSGCLKFSRRILKRDNEILLILSRISSDLYKTYHTKSPRSAVENLRVQQKSVEWKPYFLFKGANENLPALFTFFVRFG